MASPEHVEILAQDWVGQEKIIEGRSKQRPYFELYL